MGLISDALRYAGMDVATEAEDITKTLDTDVNNIFGTKNNQKDKSDANSDDTPEDTVDNSNTDQTDASTDDIDTDTEDGFSTDDPLDGGDDTGSDDTQDDGELRNKQMMHDKMMYLYETLKSNISLLSEYVPPVITDNGITIMNNIITNLSECRGILEDILTKETYSIMSYPELMKKYVGINRVYDLSIEMLDRYFQEFAEEDKPQLTRKEKVKEKK